MLNEIVRDFRRDAEHHIDDAIRHACVSQGADQFGRRCWRFLRRLNDHGTPGTQGGAKLANRLAHKVKQPTFVENCDHTASTCLIFSRTNSRVE